jgi:hypothetical protein
MRRIVIAAVALASAAAGTLVIERSRAIDDQQVAKEAERTFAANLAKGDQKAVSGALDRRFTWTDADGLTRNRRDTLKDVAALAAAAKGDDSDVQTNFYGRMLTVRGTHGDARFLRIFVKRRHGWKALVVFETPVSPADAPASVEQAAGAGDCDNPCRSVPYTPKTTMDKDILAAWQKTKLLEWKPDAAQWANFIADEFMIINNTTIRDKEQRVAIARRQQDAGSGAPGDPVTAMRIYDFGTNAAVMTSQHMPYRGGKPYTNVRVWVRRDGRWQLALSQQVTIQSATPVAAVATGKS